MRSGLTVAVLFLAAASVPSCTAGDPAFETAAASIRQNNFSDFDVIDVIDENGEVIRVNIRLVPATDVPSESRRRTINALSAVQAFIPQDRRVAVWAYRDEALTLEGMAFYSALTETVTYKTASELQ